MDEGGASTNNNEHRDGLRLDQSSSRTDLFEFQGGGSKLTLMDIENKQVVVIDIKVIDSIMLDHGTKTYPFGTQGKRRVQVPPDLES